MSLSSDDKRYIWHPFTPMKLWEQGEPPVIAEGDGAIIRDTAGREYIDGVSSLWCNVHGHRCKAIDDAIRAQLGRIAHSTLLGLANVPSIELARRLVQKAPPGLTRVFYSDNGSTAVEVALKMAFQYQRQRPDPKPRKTRFLALQNGYHGDTIGSVGVGGIELFHGLYKPLLMPAMFAPSPYCYRCPLGKTRETCGLACAAELERMVDEHADELAAVVMEPLVQGAGGIITAPPGYLRRAREITRRRDVLLILDEVATGFGRTGKMFACEHESVSPDLMAVSKGISGGYLPLAATLATDSLYNAFLADPHENRTFFHGHTYTGNPLACAAGIASLDLFDTDRTLEKLQPKIARLTAHLQRLARLEHVGDVRQCGFIAGIELVADRSTRQPYPPAHRIGAAIAMACRPRGAIIRPLGDVIVVFPPLCITDDQLDRLMRAVEEAIGEVTAGFGL
ncbi:MAG TPA: adenosylmethionine--8-amino-7-oxononanoate transaminase [Planctomycetota bacterium]|nr:adenosylmethionine--8-amino-7-oxononanoate transaminase [Planctomycetota bacterium]